MTQEEFIGILDNEGYSYEIEGDKIIITGDGDVDLDDLTSLPPGVVFRNEHTVDLDDLTSLPPGVEFRNGDHVFLRSLISLPPDVEFKNGCDVYLYSLTSLPPGVEFKNRGDVYLKSLIGGWYNDLGGNIKIKGIDSKRLLNLMIKKGMFI